MEWWVTLVLIFICLMFLFLIGVPVAFAFLFINIIGVYIFWGGEAGFSQLIRSIYRSVATFALLPVPLFVLMGEIMSFEHAGRWRGDSVLHLVRLCHGRLCHAWISTCTGDGEERL